MTYNSIVEICKITKSDGSCTFIQIEYEYLYLHLTYTVHLLFLSHNTPDMRYRRYP